MKILFVLEHFYPYIGGAEKLFYVLATKLVEEGYEVVVVTTRFDKKLKKKEQHKGIHIIRINCWNRFGFTFFSLPKVIQYARRAEVIHTTTYNAALPAILAGKILKKPVFVTFHEVWGDLWKSLPFTSPVQKYGFYFFEKILLRMPFSKFIAVSNFTKNKLQEHGIPSDKIVRVYNGIEYRHFKNYQHSPDHKFTFTYFGRLGISKGLDILIPAAAQFRKLFPDSVFKLIIPTHPKPLYEKIMALVEAHGLEDYIQLLHNLPREILYREILYSSCVVIPSYSEGFCFAAAETVALGVPIISSHRGALPEVVSGKYIVIEKMDVTSLSKALADAGQEKWSEKPLQYFYLTKTIQAYMDIYEQEKGTYSPF